MESAVRSADFRPVHLLMPCVIRLLVCLTMGSVLRMQLGMRCRFRLRGVSGGLRCAWSRLLRLLPMRSLMRLRVRRWLRLLVPVFYRWR